MSNNKLENNIIKATKWAGITEIIAKLVGPITNMILARLLLPEVFGIVATITMIVSFADMITDSGFQKYLIQHEFDNEIERNKCTDVAFWTNLVISIILWIAITLFSDNLARMVGNSGLGFVISIASIQLPITSFSSIQMAIYKREFNFKTLFYIRLIGIVTPFIITIPLAILGYGYWSLIIGNLCGSILNSMILTIKSKWKPSRYYSIKLLKRMLSFSIWTLAESIAIWMTMWIDTFIIGNILNDYYLGIYKNSISMVNSIFVIVTATTTPILFSALSRVQSNNRDFNRIFYKMHKNVSYLILPMTLGMFVYRDTMVEILLGKNWVESIQVVGSWALSSGIIILFGNYFSEVYRAKGRPTLSFIVQLIHLIVLIPVCIIASKYKFSTFITVRSIIRLQLVITHIIVMKFCINISIRKILKNMYIPLCSSIFMAIIGEVLKKINDRFIWDILSIFICIVCYMMILMCFSKSRNDILDLLNKSKLKTILS